MNTQESELLFDLFSLDKFMIFKLKLQNDELVLDELIGDSYRFCGYDNDFFFESSNNFINQIHLEDKELFLKKRQESIENKKNTFSFPKYRFKRSDGKYIWVHHVAKILYNQDNQIESFIGYIRDISQEQELSRLLLYNSKMSTLGEMFGNIVHQWKQPLSTIMASVTSFEILKEYDKLDDEIFYEGVENIKNNVLYLSETIDDFKDMILDNKKVSSFKISKVIQKSLDILKVSFQVNKIKVIESIDDNIIIDGHFNNLLQVLINILNNAKDQLKLLTNDKKRLIFIELKKTKNKIVLNIKDNGGGIDESILPQIFEAYFTTKSKTNGTGIGLYMSQNIIKKYFDSEIKVKNDIVKYKGISYKSAVFSVEFS